MQAIQHVARQKILNSGLWVANHDKGFSKVSNSLSSSRKFVSTRLFNVLNEKNGDIKQQRYDQSLYIDMLQMVVQANKSFSKLTITPTTDDNGRILTCRAENPSMMGKYLNSSWKLNVVCKYHLRKAPVKSRIGNRQDLRVCPFA